MSVANSVEIQPGWPRLEKTRRSVSPPRRRPRGWVLSRATLVLVLALTALTVLVVARAAQVAATERQLLQWREEMRLLAAENRRLEAQILELRSLRRVEAEAMGRLGMSRPEVVRPVPLATEAAVPWGAGEEMPRTVRVALAPPLDGPQAPVALLRLDAMGVLFSLGRVFSH